MLVPVPLVVPGAVPVLRARTGHEEIHRDKRRRGASRVSHLRSMRGPSFCPAKITEGVRDYAARLEEAEAGMAETSVEVREKGAEVYLPVVARTTAEAGETVAAD
jgi:hypothetical protein